MGRTAASALMVVAAALAACGGPDDAGDAAALDTLDPPTMAPDTAAHPFPSFPEAEIGLPLEGTEWALVELPGAPDPPAGVRATLVLDRERSLVYGSTGCNAFDGSYAFAGSRMTLSVTGLSRQPCAAETARLQADYLEALRLAGSWRLAGDTLELLGETGVVARFNP